MRSFTAHTAATLHTLGVRVRDRFNELQDRIDGPRQDERGFTVIEYAIMAGIIIAIAIAFGVILNSVYNKYAATVT